jgi:hypothetical protein
VSAADLHFRVALKGASIAVRGRAAVTPDHPGRQRLDALADTLDAERRVQGEKVPSRRADPPSSFAEV